MPHPSRSVLLLSLALAASLVAHALRGGAVRGAPEQAHVVAFERQGPDAEPLLLLDFDRPMVAPDLVGRDEGPVGLSLDPAAALQGRWLTARRLAVRSLRPLPLFRTWRVVLPPDLADAAGRPAVADVDLSFPSGRFGLRQPPRTRVDADGTAHLSLTFAAPPRGTAPLAGVRLLDGEGAERRVRWARGDDPAAWTGTVEGEVPQGEAALLLPPSLGPAGGGDALGAEERVALRWSATLRVTWAGVEGGPGPGASTLVLELSHELAEQDLAPQVEVLPAPGPLALRSTGAELRLTGAFPVGGEARVRLRRGLRARGGLALEQDVVRVLRVPRPEPEVAIVGDGSVLSTEAAPEVLLTGVNLPRVRVTLRPVYANNLVPVALGWAPPAEASARGVTREVALPALPDTPFTHRLDLADLLGERPRGAWWLQVADPAHPWRDDTRLLQISDLAPVVRVRPEGLLTWVLGRAGGAPRSGVTVRALSRANQTLAEGVTDADGLLLLRGPFAEEPYVVTAAAGEEIAWVDLDTHALAHAARDVEGEEPARGVEALVLPASGVVRPGDTLAVTVLLRTPTGAPPPEGFPVRLSLRAPDGREVRRETQRTGAQGLLAVDLPFALDASTGPRTLRAESADGSTLLGRAAFRVEAVLPDRLEPSLDLPEGAVALGAALEVGLGARLLSGEPAAGRRARLVLHARPAPAREEDGFTYGDAVDAPAAFERPVGECLLGDDGRGALPLVLPGPNAAGRALDLDLVLEVLDVSGRGAFARRRLRAEPEGPALGLAPGARVADGLRVRLARAPAGTVAAEVRVERVRWRQGRRHLERQAALPLVLTDGEGRADLPPLADGEHVLRVTAPGCQPAAVALECWEGRLGPAQEAQGAPRLPLRLLGPGEVALEAPFAGQGLLTVEGPGVLVARRVEVAAGEQRLRVEVPDVPAPNVHVTLTLVRPQRAAGDGPVRLVGAVRLPIERPERRLALALRAPEQVEPEGLLRVVVSAPEPCEVRVHVVDEGLLRLTGHGVPDPAARFAVPRRLGTRLADTFTRLLAGARFPGEAGDPGGDHASDPVLAARLDPAARRTIETLALASARTTLDGETELTFPLPAFEGRVRVVVLGASARGTGAASAAVLVRGPVGLALHVPRAVCPGDLFEVPVQVRGDDVVTAVELEGLTLLAHERPPGAPEVLHLRADDLLGPASVTVTATDREGRRARRRAALAVRPAAPLEVRREALAREAGTHAGRAGDDLLPATRRVRLSVGGSPLAPLRPLLDTLLEYPYGCVEQTTSRAFPLLAASGLARLLAAEGGAPPDALPAAVERLLSMQLEDGALATWPGGTSPSPYGSAYAAHLLVEARAGGQAVPAEPLARLLSALERGLADGTQGAYAAYVLARAGRAPVRWLERLAESAPTHEERAWLSSALVLVGEGERAAALLAQAEDPAAVAREDGGRLASPLRAAATLLTALLAARPEDARIPGLVERLTDAASDPDRLTTQESAAVLLALVRAEERRRDRGAPARGTLTAGGRTRTFDGEHEARIDLGPDDDPAWTLTADGPAVLRLRVQGVPAAPASRPPSEGWALARRLEGEPAALRSGEVYTLVLTGRAPAGSANLLLSDLLPGGLEGEDARAASGTYEPDRIEPRDDRVLFFRTDPHPGAFEVRYRVRAVTAGRFAWPAAALEGLYLPGQGARTPAGARLEVRAAGEAGR